MSEEYCELSNLFNEDLKIKLIYDNILDTDFKGFFSDYELYNFTEDLNNLIVALKNVYVEDDDDDDDDDDDEDYEDDEDYDEE